MSQSPPQSERVVTLFLGGDKHGGQGAGGGRQGSELGLMRLNGLPEA